MYPAIIGSKAKKKKGFSIICFVMDVSPKKKKGFSIICFVMDVSPLCFKAAYEPLMVGEGNSRTGAFHPMPITTGYTACSVTEF